MSRFKISPTAFLQLGRTHYDGAFLTRRKEHFGRLIERDGGPVAIALRASCDSLPALYAALESGCECALVDPQNSAVLTQALGASQIVDDDCAVTDEAVSAASACTPAETFLVLTSGSCAQPKVIRRSVASWLASFASEQEIAPLKPTDRVALFGYLWHSLTLYGALETLQYGAGLGMFSLQKSAELRRALQDFAPTRAYITPAQLRLLARISKAPLASMQQVFVGGGALDAATRRVATKHFPNAHLRAFYGAAELGFVTCADQHAPDASVGRAFPGVSIAVRDTLGRRCAAHQVGDIWVRSDLVFNAYAATPKDEVRRCAQGYLSIGELGCLDERGNVFIKGRRQRVVRVADQNVFLDLLEADLRLIAGVLEVAVIGVPDTRRGQVLHAFFWTDPTQDKSAVKAACQRTCGQNLMPKAFVFLARWPYLAAGKTDYQRLASLAEPDLRDLS